MHAWINGVSLTDAIPNMILRNVYEDDPENDLMTGERPGMAGQRILSIKRTQLAVRIETVCREIYDLRARAEAVQAMAAWAQDGRLELSNRPDQFLQCIVTKRPAPGTDRDYTQTFTVELAAIDCPYWQAMVPDSVSGSGTTGTLHLTPGGTVKRIPLSFTVTPSSGTLTSFSVTVGGRTIALSGLSVSSSSSLVLDYDDHMLQRIRVGSTSVMSKRTAASADNLLVDPMTDNTIAFTADVASAVEFTARGWYL